MDLDLLNVPLLILDSEGVRLVDGDSFFSERNEDLNDDDRDEYLEPT